jgi:hypothetical protein
MRRDRRPNATVGALLTLFDICCALVAGIGYRAMPIVRTICEVVTRNLKLGASDPGWGSLGTRENGSDNWRRSGMGGLVIRHDATLSATVREEKSQNRPDSRARRPLRRYSKKGHYFDTYSA